MHDGHRQRMKSRFAEEGLTKFNEIQALELLLFYAIPRKDTNPTAHLLLDRFGSMARVLDANIEELCKVPGISWESAVYLKLLGDTSRYYQINRMKEQTDLSSVEKCSQFLIPRFYGFRNEQVGLLCLDAKCRLISMNMLGEGTVCSANVSIRRLVETALGCGAVSCVLAHNHPSGIPSPSQEDIDVTFQVAQAFATLEIALSDHIILSDNNYVSLLESGLYRPVIV